MELLYCHIYFVVFIHPVTWTCKTEIAHSKVKNWKKTFVCLSSPPPPFLELQGKETGNMKAMIKRSIGPHTNPLSEIWRKINKKERAWNLNCDYCRDSVFPRLNLRHELKVAYLGTCEDTSPPSWDSITLCPHLWPCVVLCHCLDAVPQIARLKANAPMCVWKRAAQRSVLQNSCMSPLINTRVSQAAEARAQTLVHWTAKLNL